MDQVKLLLEKVGKQIKEIKFFCGANVNFLELTGAMILYGPSIALPIQVTVTLRYEN